MNINDDKYCNLFLRDQKAVSVPTPTDAEENSKCFNGFDENNNTKCVIDERLPQILVENPQYIIFNEKRNCLKNLRECVSCDANRQIFPNVRKKVEELVIEKALKFGNQDKLVICDFGGAGLFQTTVILQKLFNLNKWKSIELHSIDPHWARVVFPLEMFLEEGISADEVDRDFYVTRLSQFKSWFEAQDLKLDVYIYPHLYEYKLWCDKNPIAKPDITIAIDYIDECTLTSASRDFVGMIALTSKSETQIIALRTVFEVCYNTYELTEKFSDLKEIFENMEFGDTKIDIDKINEAFVNGLTITEH